eukprot:7997687-Alexandrium_andersonii.AAC.1
MSASLVGSEMCIRDRFKSLRERPGCSRAALAGTASPVHPAHSASGHVGDRVSRGAPVQVAPRATGLPTSNSG